MQIGVMEAAQKLMRTYGDLAESECDARVSYYQMQGDKTVAEGWRRTRQAIALLREQGWKP